MSLGSDLAAALPGLRASAESRFTETFKAYTVTESAPDAEGAITTTEVTVHAAVVGRVKYPSLTVRERDQGAQVPAVQDVEIHVGVGAAPNVTVGVMWRCTASTADPSLVGREFRTKGLWQAGQVTAWRIPVESVS